MSPILRGQGANKEMLVYNCGNARGPIDEALLSPLNVSYLNSYLSAFALIFPILPVFKCSKAHTIRPPRTHQLYTLRDPCSRSGLVWNTVVMLVVELLHKVE